MKLKEDPHNAEWIDPPPRFSIPGGAILLTDRTEPYTAEELQRAADAVSMMEKYLISTTPTVTIMAGVSSIAISCATIGSSYVYRVIKDGQTVGTFPYNEQFCMYSVAGPGTYQVAVSIDGAPEILSDTVAMDKLEMPPRADLHY